MSKADNSVKIARLKSEITKLEGDSKLIEQAIKGLENKKDQLVDVGSAFRRLSDKPDRKGKRASKLET